MASSNQCANCGNQGHFRNSCPEPTNPSREHWNAAQAQFRRENPEEQRKIKRKRQEREKWQREGEQVSFSVIKKTVEDMIQTLYELSSEMDILGRPDDWKNANKKLDTLLPLIREITNTAKGFIYYGGMRDIVVDGDIFRARLSDLRKSRDQLVADIKSFVNGKLGKLASVHGRKNPAELLRFLYENHPPKTVYTFQERNLTGSTLKVFLRKALLHYHPDKQGAFDLEWRVFCEAISRCLTDAYSKFQ